MTIESPMLAAGLFPVALLALWATRGNWPTAGKWLLRLTVLLLLAAIAGPVVQRERPLTIAVMVDVSPSTRGATFRDSKSLESRLTPLLAGRPYSIRYFADGEQPTATEPPAAQTRLTPPNDADAVLLLSDGRLTISGSLPPIYPILDPALDSPGDAAVLSIRPLPPPARSAGNAGGARFAVDLLGQAGRAVQFEEGRNGQHVLPNGPVTIDAESAGRLTARITPGDRWPENDSLTALPARGGEDRIAVDLMLPGFRPITMRAVTTQALDLLNTTMVALPSGALLSAGQEQAIEQYVRQLGGTLALIGGPNTGGRKLEAMSPLTARPFEGPGAWVILLDASGSMAGEVSGVSKWKAALMAAVLATRELPDTARVSVLRFAGMARAIASDVSPREAEAAIREAENDPPTGRTGLRSALLSASAAAAASGGAHVLLLTDGQADLGDLDSLTRTLRDARVTLSAISTSAVPKLAELCQATGGLGQVSATPAGWAIGFSSLARPPESIIVGESKLFGRGAWADRTFITRRRWETAVKARSHVLLTADDGFPMAAEWQVGNGRVLALAADADDRELASALSDFARTPADPRFSFAVSDTADELTLTAIDNDGLMNGLTVTAERAGSVLLFTQAAPGRYRAALERSADASLATVKVDDAVVARLAVPGRYAKEFDVIGNDRPALAALAKRSGGAVIEAGDNRPIQFPRLNRPLLLRPWLAGLSAIAGIGSVLALRRR